MEEQADKARLQLQADPTAPGANRPKEVSESGFYAAIPGFPQANGGVSEVQPANATEIPDIVVWG
jgi:hypothetical protein